MINYSNEIKLKELKERRKIERRAGERRKNCAGYSGIEQRKARQERRVTVYNRFNKEVTDRRNSA